MRRELKFPKNATTITFTAAHVAGLRGCYGGQERFRRAFPQGLVLNEAKLQQYAGAQNTPISRIEVLYPSWVFDRLNFGTRQYIPTIADVRFDSRDKQVLAAKKAVRDISSKRDKELREAALRITRKYAPKISKANRALSAACKVVIAAKKAAMKATHGITLANFITKFNSYS